MAQQPLKLAASKKRQGRIRLNCTLTYGGLENANGRHSGVDVAHRCFPEGGDSILSVFSWDPLRAKL